MAAAPVTPRSKLGVRVWLKVHRWTSLVCTLFLLLSCVTGLPLIFTDELTPSAPRLLPTAAGERAQLSVHEVVSRAAGPTRYPQFVYLDDEQPSGVGIGLAPTADAELEAVERVLFDRRTGLRLPAAEPGSPLLQLALDIHRDLLLGPWGDLILACVALLFVVSLVSGIVVYGPFMRRLDFGEIRAGKRVVWLDLHNLVGIATVTWALVVGATGFMNTLEGALFSAWQSEHLPTPAEHASTMPLGAARPIDDVLAAASGALPGMAITSVGLAGTRYGLPSQHLAWLHGSSNLTKRLFATAIIDAVSGEVLRAEALPWYLRALEVSRPLHFGDYGGLPLKILWAIFDVLSILVLISGLVLFAKRGRVSSQRKLTSAASVPRTSEVAG